MCWPGNYSERKLSDIIHEAMQDIVTSPQLAGPKFRALYEHAMIALQDGYAVEIVCKPLKSTRSLAANRAMWAHLADIARDVNWYGKKLSAENWKEVISASLRKQDVVAGIDGNFVVLGVKTSKMSIAEMSSMIETCISFGHDQGVRFTAPKWMDEK